MATDDPPRNPLFRVRKRPVFRARRTDGPTRDPHVRSGVFAEPPEVEVYQPDPLADDYAEPHEFDFLPSRPGSPGLLRFWPSAAFAIVPCICAVACLIVSMVGWSTGLDERLWASGESVLARGEWYRLFTALFVHGDVSHWANNVWLLVLFGWLLQGYFGPVAFPLASFVCGIVSNWVTVWWYEPDIRLYGASGMVYAMVGMWLVLYIRHDTETRKRSRVMRATGFALLMLFPQTYEPHTSYAAHASGFVAGLLAALIMAPWIKPRSAPESSH